MSLWLDEAEWAEALLREPLREQGIRPLALLWLTRLLANAFGAHEAILRLPSYLAGVAVIPLVYAIGRYLLQSRVTRAALPWTVALHPLLIDFAKEFKPYSVSAACHALLLSLALRALSSDNRRQVWQCVVGAIALLPISYDVLFAYPAVFGVLAWRALTRQRRTELIGVLGAALVACGGIVTLYVGVWTDIDEHSYGPAYWGHKYDVFLTENRQTALGPQPASAVAWYWTKVGEMFAGPAFAKDDWSRTDASPIQRELSTLHGILYGPLFLLGAFFAFQRKRLWCTLLVGPLAVLVLFNLAGRWPLGFFRVNLFTLVYTLTTAMVALDHWLASSASGRWRRAALILLFAILPRLSFNPPLASIKVSRPWAAHSELRKILHALAAQPTTGRPPLFADYYSYQSLSFYETLHPNPPRTRLAHRFRLQRTMTVPDVERALRQSRDPEAWVLVSRQGFVEPTRALLHRHCASVVELDFGAHHLVARCHQGRTQSFSP